MITKITNIIQEDLKQVEKEANFLLNSMSENNEDYEYYKHEYLVKRELISYLHSLLDRINAI